MYKKYYSLGGMEIRKINLLRDKIIYSVFFSMYISMHNIFSIH